MQYFKGDDIEKKIYNSAVDIIRQLSGQKDLFYEDAYNAYPLGDVLYMDDISPLSNAVKKSIFRESFNEIFNAFTVSGSFESYLSVFRKIFGDAVVVEFIVPDPGKLQINIQAEGVELSKITVREIVANQYVFYDLITQTGDNIVFQTAKGFESQYELEQMLKELVPAGIYTEITLDLG